MHSESGLLVSAGVLLPLPKAGDRVRISRAGNGDARVVPRAWDAC